MPKSIRRTDLYWYPIGRLPSGVAGYGVCGLTGHKSLSKTHRESKPASFSAKFAIWITFSLVACCPACGKVIPFFKVIPNYIMLLLKRSLKCAD
jgi:hypothetical protein